VSLQLLTLGSVPTVFPFRCAILSANYMAARLDGAWPVLFKGINGRCAHEFIIDARQVNAVAC